MKIVHAALVCFSLIIIGCGARSELMVPEPSAPAPVVADDAPLSTDASDATDASDGTDSATVVDVADAADTTDVVDVPDTTDATDGHVGVIHVIPELTLSREERIVTSANLDWQVLGRGCLVLETEPADIDRINVGSLADAASYDQFALFVGGSLVATGNFAGGMNANRDVDLSANQIHLDYGRATCYELKAHLASVVSHAANSATSGVARSGAPVGLGINIGLETGAWDSSYRGHYNVRARGRVSGQQLYAEAPTPTLTFPNPSVVYRTRLNFSALPLPTTTLVDGAELQFQHWRVSAEHGSASWMQDAFYMGAGDGRRYQATGFRLLRDGVALSRGQVSIVDFDTGRDVMDGTLQIEGGVPLTTAVQIVLSSEEIVNEAGTEYTLVGMITTPIVSGDTLIGNRFYPSTEVPGPFYLTDRALTGMYQLDTSPWSLTGPISPGPSHRAIYIWSDLTEVPHVANPGTRGGSRDWIGEAFLYGVVPTDLRH